MFQRLVTCKTCGHSIANTAKKCPHCGAKQHTAVYVLVTIMVLIFFIASAAIIRSAVVTGDHSDDSAPPPAASISLKITAEELYRTYAENTVNADNLYKGKTICILIRDGYAWFIHRPMLL